MIFTKWMVVALLMASAAPATRPNANELLQQSDRSRGGLKGGLVWDITIDSVEDGNTTQRSFKVKARGDDALASATAPSRNKGEVFLFNNRTMWFYKPGLRKPVAISARQKLTGQAANGDIASTHYSRDYEGEVTGSEVVAGERAWVVELKAKNKDVTYDQIRYWISEKAKLGLKAEFLSLEGKVLKTATFEYGNSVQSEGAKLPFVSKMKIQDAKIAANHSTITYQQPTPAEIAPSTFNINNLVQ